jgi:hypothetical protein
MHGLLICSVVGVYWPSSRYLTFKLTQRPVFDISQIGLIEAGLLIPTGEPKLEDLVVARMHSVFLSLLPTEKY